MTSWYEAPPELNRDAWRNSTGFYTQQFHQPDRKRKTYLDVGTNGVMSDIPPNTTAIPVQPEHIQEEAFRPKTFELKAKSRAKISMEQLFQPLRHANTEQGLKQFQETLKEHDPHTDWANITDKELEDRISKTGMSVPRAIGLVEHLRRPNGDAKKNVILESIRRRGLAEPSIPAEDGKDSKFFQELIQYHKQEEERTMKEHALPTDSVRMSDECINNVGEDRLHMFDEDLRCMVPQRSRFQEEFHEACIPPLMPHIYGSSEFSRSYVDILDKLDRNVLPVMILLHLRRRGGKTDGAARLAAACGDIFPDGKKINCLAQTLEMSQIFLAVIKLYFRQLPNAEERIVKETVNEFWVLPRGTDIDFARANGWKNFNKINKFRACAGTLRGNLHSLPYSSRFLYTYCS